MRDAYKGAISGKVIGLYLDLDSSPMRIFGLGGVPGRHDILAKSARVSNEVGVVTPLAPRACAPCMLRTCAQFLYRLHYWGVRRCMG